MKVALVGKSCSGKTHFAQLLQQKGLKVAVACTSRPKRHMEIEGIDYYFLNRNAFLKKIKKDEFIEYNEFNSWIYGLPKSEFEKSDIIIVTPQGLKNIIELYGRKSLIVIYMDADNSVRIARSSKRGDDPEEIIRRFLADENDFCEFIINQDWDIKINQKSEDSFKNFLCMFLNFQNKKN